MIGILPDAAPEGRATLGSDPGAAAVPYSMGDALRGVAFFCAHAGRARRLATESGPKAVRGSRQVSDDDGLTAEHIEAAVESAYPSAHLRLRLAIRAYPARPDSARNSARGTSRALGSWPAVRLERPRELW
jgi:hypothetical protein